MAKIMDDITIALTDELKEEVKALRIALQEKDESFKAYIEEEVKKQVDERFEAYSRLLGMQVPTNLNRFYK